MSNPTIREAKAASLRRSFEFGRDERNQADEAFHVALNTIIVV